MSGGLVCGVRASRQAQALHRAWVARGRPGVPDGDRPFALVSGDLLADAAAFGAGGTRAEAGVTAERLRQLTGSLLVTRRKGRPVTYACRDGVQDELDHRAAGLRRRR